MQGRYDSLDLEPGHDFVDWQNSLQHTGWTTLTSFHLVQASHELGAHSGSARKAL
jgi:hypothetical protein